MKAIITALKEVYGLFVEDGNYAAAILIWLAVVMIVFRFLPATGGWKGPALFAGMALILLQSVIRAAKNSSAP